MLNIQTIADRAVLVKFTKRTITQYKKDKAATATVESAYGVKAGNYNKRLLQDSPIVEAANKAAQEAYQYYFDNTSPWLDEDGLRMLRADRILDFTQALNDRIAAAQSKFNEVVWNWSSIVHADVAKLGALGNYSDYPADVSDKFALSYALRPVPSGNDFRVNIPESELKKVEDAHKEAEKVAVKDAVSRIMQPVAAAAKRLAEFTKGEQEGKKQRFHDSIILNIAEQSRQARMLNIMDDPELDKLCSEVDTLLKPYFTDPEQVKDDVLVREAAQAKLDDIMSKMAGWM